MINSRRFIIVLMTLILFSVLAILKHWYSGVDNTIVGITAGVVTAYLGAETYRRSPYENNKK